MSKISKSIGLLAISSLLSRILGVYRDHLFAQTFTGLGSVEAINSLDIYYAAFKLPDFIFQILVLGAISTAFVPIFTSIYEKNGDDNAWRFLINITQILSIALGAFCFLLFLLMPYIIPYYVPGFSLESQLMTVDITRLMLICPFFFCLSGILQSVQNSFHKFTYFAISPVLYNLAIIIATYFWAADYGIIGVTYGVIIGSFLHFACQLPAIKGINLYKNYNFNIFDKNLKSLIKLATPRILAISSMQLIQFTDVFVASYLTIGSLTILNYSINIQSLPLGLIAISISIVSFGYFSKLVVGEEYLKLENMFTKNILQILGLVIPSIFGLFIVGDELIQLILMSDTFIESDVLLTFNVLKILLIALLFQSIIPLYQRLFYAFHDTKSTVIATIIAVMSNVILSLLFVFKLNFDVTGLAYSTLIASGLHMLTLYILSHYKLDKINTSLPFASLIKVIFSSTLMYLVIIFFNQYINVSNTFLYIIIITVLGIVTYGLTMQLLKINLKKLYIDK